LRTCFTSFFVWAGHSLENCSHIGISTCMINRTKIKPRHHDLEGPLVLLPHRCCVYIWPTKIGGIDEFTRSISGDICFHEINMWGKIVIECNFFCHNDFAFLKNGDEVLEVSKFAYFISSCIELGYLWSTAPYRAECDFVFDWATG